MLCSTYTFISLGDVEWDETIKMSKIYFLSSRSHLYRPQRVISVGYLYSEILICGYVLFSYFQPSTNHHVGAVMALQTTDDF